MRYFDTESFEIEYEYDVVLLIGNGFDLNYGLKTGYCDFIKSKNFTDLLIDNNNELATHLKSRHNIENWIDIENELKNYSKFYSGLKPDFFKDYKNLSLALMSYLNNLEIKSNSKCTSYKLIESIANLSTLIVDFNYTPTLQKIFKELEKQDYNLHIDHVKIHGSLETDIIFGVEDKANIYEKDVFLKKSVNENFKAIDFSEAINTCSNFIIFGHSLGETDYMYYEDFFKKASKSKNYDNRNIILYYHGEESYYNIFRQIDKLTSKNVTKFRQYNKVKLINTLKTSANKR
jgi:hypothetical protein